MSSMILNVTFDCADPRALARFWGEVTGWPVTEEPRPGHEESAVGEAGQGRPRLYFVKVPEGKTVKNRLHLDIMPVDRTQDEEIARLTGLGARVISDRRPEFGWVLLSDPEGNEFDVEISVAELDAELPAIRCVITSVTRDNRGQRRRSTATTLPTMVASSPGIGV